MRRTAIAFSEGGVGVVFMVAAALCYGGMSISAKLSIPYLTVWQTAVGRFVLGAAVIPLLARSLRFNLRGTGLWLLVILGVTSTGSFVLFIQALTTISLSEGMVLFYLWPVFACLLSAWVAGEPTTKGEWPFVIGALTGTVLILLPERTGPGINLGHFLVLGASSLAGLAVILVRRLRRTNNPFTIYFYFCLVGGLVCLGPLLTPGHSVLPASRAGWVVLAAVAVFALFGNVLMNQGMKHLNASKTGVLMMLEVVTATAFGAVFLGEVLSVRFLCGSALILGCGVAIIVLPMYFTPLLKENTPTQGG